MCAEIKAMPYTRILSKIGNGLTMTTNAVTDVM